MGDGDENVRIGTTGVMIGNTDANRIKECLKEAIEISASIFPTEKEPAFSNSSSITQAIARAIADLYPKAGVTVVFGVAHGLGAIMGTCLREEDINAVLDEARAQVLAGIEDARHVYMKETKGNG